MLHFQIHKVGTIRPYIKGICSKETSGILVPHRYSILVPKQVTKKSSRPIFCI